MKLSSLKQHLFLSENAKLFDTKEYLLKAFVAVLIAGLIGKYNNYVNRDMISLLFGMMLTLEPVNISGIRSGFDQIKATIIGAIITGLIVTIFGYNIFSMAFGIAATLYVCMLINWRESMVPAVFTAIYMTQYIQLDALGQNSSIETLKLRLAALGTGVAIAFIVNFVFSLVGYRKMAQKRIYFLSRELYDHTFEIKAALAHHDLEKVQSMMSQIAPLFNTIDWVTGTLADVKSDQQKFKIVYRHVDCDPLIHYCKALRGTTHVVYDLCQRTLTRPDVYTTEAFISAFEERLGHFESIKNAFENDIPLPTSTWATINHPWLDEFSRTLETFNTSPSEK